MKRFMAYGLVLFQMILLNACQKEASVPESNSAIQYYYHSGTEDISDALFLRDGGTAYVGNALGQGYLFVTDENGKEKWKAYVGGDDLDLFYSVIELQDGGFVALGATTSFDLGVTNNNPDAWMVKFSQSGKILWQKTLGTTNMELFTAGIEDKNGDLFFVGIQSSGNLRSLLAKYSANGDLIYSRTVRVGPWHSGPGGVAQAPTGEYIIGGLNSVSVNSAEVGNNVTHMLVVNPDNGKVILTQIFQDDVRGDNISYSVKMDVCISGNEVTLASFFEVPVKDARVQIIRAKMDGTLVFEKKISGQGNLYFSNLDKTPDGGYLLCGFTSPLQNTLGGKQAEEGSVIKLSPDCEEEWSSAFGVPNINLNVISAVQTASGYRVIGQSYNNKKPLRQLMRYRLNTKGEVVYD